MKNRLSYYRKQKGLTQIRLAELVGTSKLQISRLERGERQLTPKWMARIAPHLGCLPEQLISTEIENKVIPTGHIPVKVLGYVQAGHFGEADELSVRDEDVMYVSPKYPDAHCLIVKGDSMNLRYKDGTKLICVPFYGEVKDIKPGRAVIVEAVSMDDGSEITVKEFYTDENGRHWLLPRSTNPTYQNYPIPKNEDVDVIINGHKIRDIIIRAIVVSYQYDED